MGVFIEVIAATLAYGGFVFIFNHRNSYITKKIILPARGSPTVLKNL